MNEPDALIAPATERDRDVVVACLTIAFAADPIARWMFGPADRYLASFPRLAAALSRPSLAAGTSWLTRSGDGVAIWVRPGDHGDDDAVARALTETITPDLADDVARLAAWTESHAPREPHWYLSLIGTEPSCRGRGYGAALLAAGLRAVDADRRAAYLWSSNPQNIPFYRHQGFEVVAETRFGRSPSIFAMHRAPIDPDR